MQELRRGLDCPMRNAQLKTPSDWRTSRSRLRLQRERASSRNHCAQSASLKYGSKTIYINTNRMHMHTHNRRMYIQLHCVDSHSGNSHACTCLRTGTHAAAAVQRSVAASPTAHAAWAAHQHLHHQRQQHKHRRNNKQSKLMLSSPGWLTHGDHFSGGDIIYNSCVFRAALHGAFSPKLRQVKRSDTACALQNSQILCDI